MNPGAEEVCNQYDDDCNGDVDEGVRPQCGEGWCLRDADTCEGSICFLGEPRDEQCNLFDEDCDGEVDEAAPCPEAEVCIAGLCRPESEASIGGGGLDGADGTPSSASTDRGASIGSGGTRAENSNVDAGASRTPSGSCSMGAPSGRGLPLLWMLALARRRASRPRSAAKQSPWRS